MFRGGNSTENTKNHKSLSHVRTRAALANDSTLTRPSSSFTAASSSALRERDGGISSCEKWTNIDAPDISKLHDDSGFSHCLGNFTFTQETIAIFIKRGSGGGQRREFPLKRCDSDAAFWSRRDWGRESEGDLVVVDFLVLDHAHPALDLCSGR
jgi:hypothetical protein